MVKDLQGAIVAAGSGERLRRDAGDIPKPLVRLGGEALLVRQAGAMMRAGAAAVLAVVNSETAEIIGREKTEIPRELKIIVRDTANSMESLFALGEKLRPGYFLLATVDAVIPDGEFARFVTQALRMCEIGTQGFDGALGVVKWRGDRRPLFAKVSHTGAILALGEQEAAVVTAGVYFLSTRIFDFTENARREGLEALRRFLAMLIEKGLRLGAIELSGVIDVDEAADLEAARAALEVRR